MPGPRSCTTTAPSATDDRRSARRCGRTWRRCRRGWRSPARRRRRGLDHRVVRRRRRPAAVATLGPGGHRRGPPSPSTNGSAGALVDGSPGQRHDLLDQPDELLGLGLQVVEHRWPHLGVEVGVAAQHGEVRAHAGQRRAQLVAGVLDEPLLGVTRAGQRAEHPVERRAELTDLVLAGDRHLDVEPAGALDVGGRPRQALQRRRAPCRRSATRASAAAAVTSDDDEHRPPRRSSSTRSFSSRERPTWDGAVDRRRT